VLLSVLMMWRTLVHVGWVEVGPPEMHKLVSMLWVSVRPDAQNCDALAAACSGARTHAHTPTDRKERRS
jgi:hypothetical protein